MGIFLYGSNYNKIRENDLRYNNDSYLEEFCVGNVFENNIIEDSKRKQAISIEFSIILIFSIISIITIAWIIILKKKITLLLKTLFFILFH